jgi:multiple sugar transport system substrate-binding protein
MDSKLTLDRRRFLLAAATTAALASIARQSAAADVTLPIVSKKKFEGQTIIVESQSGPVISGPIQKFGPIWEQATGAKIELVTYPFGEMFEKLRTELATGAYVSDLFNFTSGWAGDFIGGGFMEPVPDDVKALIGMDDYYPTYRDAMTWGGTMSGIVYDGNVHSTFYRRDLFENADYQKKFADELGYELKVPQTWEQFHDAGKFFNSFDWSGTGRSYGILEPMGRGTGGVYFLIGRGISYSKKEGDPHVFFDPESMKPRLTEAGWIQALEDWKRDSEVGPPGMVQYGFSEARPTFVSGQAAMITDWGDIGTLSYAKDSKVRGVTGTALVPGGSKVFDRKTQAWEKPSGAANHAPYLAVTAWLFGVPKTAENKEAAWDLAAFLCNPTSSTILVAYPDSGIQPSRNSNIKGAQYLVEAGMDAKDAEQYLSSIAEGIGHPNAVLDLRIPGGGEYYNLLDVEASRFMAGEISSEQAMKNAADGWEQTTDRLGRDRQRELYLASTGG